MYCIDDKKKHQNTGLGCPYDKHKNLMTVLLLHAHIMRLIVRKPVVFFWWVGGGGGGGGELYTAVNSSFTI